MKQCRNSWESGCRCAECHIGLAQYNPALLNQTTTLRVVTMPQPVPAHNPDECGLMVCSDPACVARNAARVGQGEGNASPFRRAA